MLVMRSLGWGCGRGGSILTILDIPGSKVEVGAGAFRVAGRGCRACRAEAA